jgi:hypothetical protein
MELTWRMRGIRVYPKSSHTHLFDSGLGTTALFALGGLRLPEHAVKVRAPREVAVVWVACPSSHSLTGSGTTGQVTSGCNQTGHGTYNKTYYYHVPIVTAMLDGFLGRGLLLPGRSLVIKLPHPHLIPLPPASSYVPP